MSWKKGASWKTGWKRQGAYGVGESDRTMWFVDLKGGANYYEMPLLAPAPFDVLPFWAGWVARTTGSTVGLTAGGGVDNVTLATLDTLTTAPTLDVGKSQIAGQSLNPTLTLPTTHYLAHFDQGMTIVSLVTAQLSGTDILFSLYMDNGLRLTYRQPGPYVAPTSKFQVVASGTSGKIAGFAAGRAKLPTAAEITAWFVGVRTTLDIPSIAGKTTDRFSAKDIQPLAATPWPNAGGGQNMNKANAGAAATNTLLAAIFNY